ncbi:mitochondrial small ribosomal subunit Rsm22-domain-containing protein [Amylostereum chailletii]|nr:mitochondrial small ribosomal subunit Rsm22-domain-containing protein [Amylostereum chailletii]
MLSSRCCRPLRGVLRLPKAPFSSSSALRANQPNGPLDLDPSFQALLQDVDMSLLKQKSRHRLVEGEPQLHRELEVFPAEAEGLPFEEEEEEEDRTTRKSPAAHFGSRQVGAAILPHELQKSIISLIEASDKNLLHSDATRLFHDKDPETWDSSYDTRYKSRKQASRHAERDGTAFASVALPAHYSAIYSVLNHTRQRLGPEWEVETVYDWGAGTGSAFWAASHVFQAEDIWKDYTTIEERQLSQSTLSSYVAIDNREGLTRIGKRLLEDVDHANVQVSWQRSFREENKLLRPEGTSTVAISAFFLASLPTPLHRKEFVKQMWESGAHTIILVDHNTKSGFANISEARDHLLRMGRREMEDPEMTSEIKGAHVVAPCPHDGPCPLYHSDSSNLLCGFSQRMQRPSFVRKTKHSGAGHEDVEYSYVVIRRGPRPTAPETRVGRLGEVGKREQQKEWERLNMVELELHEDAVQTSARPETSSGDPVPLPDAAEYKLTDEMLASLRQEAFHWPRLVFPPMKRSGHIILDVCAPEGQIIRMTIPKSQGKQPYYDARKSDWGDIFPHEPKNPSQVRYQPVRAKLQGGTTPTKGADIGKRGKKAPLEPETSYTRLANEIQVTKKQARRNKAVRRP